jgi:DNA-binding transcriptional regulator YiaG
MTKFYRFSEAVVVDRCLGLVHMYSRREIEPGRFVYIKMKKLEALYNDWNKKHIRAYRQYKSFGGDFPEIMDKYFDRMGIWVEGKPNANLIDYEYYKDKAISSIGEDDGVKSKRELKAERDLVKLKLKVTNIWKSELMTQQELAKKIGVNVRTLQSWQNLNENDVSSKENEVLDGDEEPNNLINGVIKVDYTQPATKDPAKIKKWPIFDLKVPQMN